MFFRWCNVNPSHVPWLTKVAACGFGLFFLALAFLAQYLGGLLQAALTIFGAVGGPLLGVFTLGMFTTYANEKVNNIIHFYLQYLSTLCLIRKLFYRAIEHAKYLLMKRYIVL